MKFSLCSKDIAKMDAALIALGVFEDQVGELPLFIQIDRELKGLLSRILEEEQFKAKKHEKLLVHSLELASFSRVLIIGLGKREEFQMADTKAYAAQAAMEADRRRCSMLLLALPPLDGPGSERVIQFAVEGALLGCYRFEGYKSKDSRTPKSLEHVSIWLEKDRPEPSHLALSIGEIIAQATMLARDLTNEPASTLTPRKLSEVALEMAKPPELECKVLGPKDCEKQKMNLLLAVSRGSVEEPRFIHLKYRPKGKVKPKRRIVLVGKGVTFDSGGLSLKPASSMLDMKTDMAGAAAVLAVMRALPSLGIRFEVHGLIAATENMLSGSSFRLGDIISGIGGKSVEIVNTDAEGRLILADALAYAKKLSPDEILDIATLTGSCVVALGPHIAGIMGNDLALVERFTATARRAGEEVWQLPLPERLKEQLKSPVADLKNSGDRWGGALTAGLFLREFVGQVPWVHLDIAGPAIAEKDWGHVVKGGTGFAVASLLEYLIGREEIP